jgi:hypothetical protein
VGAEFQNGSCLLNQILYHAKHTPHTNSISDQTLHLVTKHYW